MWPPGGGAGAPSRPRGRPSREADVASGGLARLLLRRIKGRNAVAPPTEDRESETRETTWGPKLFYGALVATLVFFWWLLIYSHGVAPHGG